MREILIFKRWLNMMKRWFHKSCREKSLDLRCSTYLFNVRHFDKLNLFSFGFFLKFPVASANSHRRSSDALRWFLKHFVFWQMWKDILGFELNPSSYSFQWTKWLKKLVFQKSFTYAAVFNIAVSFNMHQGLKMH